MDAREYLVPIPPLERWKRDVAARPTPFTDGLRADAPAGARSVRLFVLPCAPFAPAPKEPTLSAYYLASQALYEYVKANCARPAFRLPLKPILAGYGIGRRGRNGLVAIEGMGTCFAIEAAWSGEEAPPRAWTEEPPLDGACKDCGLCLRACPRGGAGRRGLRRYRPLSARAGGEERPAHVEEAMALTGNSLWGCDLCQLACPRNAAVRPVPMPENVRAAISLDRLLAGDTRALAPLIGANYARKARMRIRACLVAACLGKSEHLPPSAPLRPTRWSGLTPVGRRGGWKNVEKFPQYMAFPSRTWYDRGVGKKRVYEIWAVSGVERGKRQHAAPSYS